MTDEQIIARAHQRLRDLSRAMNEITVFLTTMDRLAGPNPEAAFTEQKAHSPAPEGEDLAPDSPSSNPVANAGEEANGTDAATSVDPASRGVDDAEPQQLAASGFTEGVAAVPPQSARDAVDEPGTGTVATNFTAGKPGEGAGASSSAPSRAKPIGRPVTGNSLRQRISDLHIAHPEYTVEQAVEALGCTRGSLSGYSSTLKIKWASARGTGKAQEARSPAPATEPPPAPGSEPEVPFANVNTHVVRRPKGTQFRLRDDSGRYLHNSCEFMTSDKAYAWIGQESHLIAVRRKYPLAKDLREVAVEKETRAA